MALPLEAKRFKQIRKELGLTQAEMAAAIGMNSVADAERGKVRIKGSEMAELMARFQVNPLWLYGKSKQKYITKEQSVQPKMITVEQAGRENIVAVNAKAAAGYPENISDQEWYKALPAFHVPLPRFQTGSFRMFQVDGDSMMPSLWPGEWVIARAEDSLSTVSNNTVAVVVTPSSVLIKRIFKAANNTVRLVSDNDAYAPILLDAQEIQEVWSFSARISLELNTTTNQIDHLQRSIDRLTRRIDDLTKG